ncbi:hypothetical protein Clacol_006537 [Clathrus columnatus]|uniref:INO80 complex subunit F domain-containing protein n=1 Tax=Clathrus columnatus TaxID=1419009 RepID=A0AAV5AH55_9AGAM|nr:hypothetical protein Clacol_006537 [Clathrus columnatus]
MATNTHPDDLKYIQKYTELKRKVKEIELDNDRLHLKVLKTKKNIQRLHLERAILYERLSAMPTPNPSHPLPPPPPPSSRHLSPPPSRSIHYPSHSRPYPPSRPTSPESNNFHIHSNDRDSHQQPPPSHGILPIPPPSLEEYHSPPSSSRHGLPPHSVERERERERERKRDREIGGPGLPPMRVHPYPLESSPVLHHPGTSPQANANGHGNRPYSPDERNWERQHEREREREREYNYRERDTMSTSTNGYGFPHPPPPPPPPSGLLSNTYSHHQQQRYDQHHPQRYEPQHLPHPQSPPVEYDSRSHNSHSRSRSSTSYSRDYPPPPPHSHHPPPPNSHLHSNTYDYPHSSLPHSAGPPADGMRRPEGYEYEDRRQQSHHLPQLSRTKERDTEPPVPIPRVRDGETME